MAPLTVQTATRRMKTNRQCLTSNPPPRGYVAGHAITTHPINGHYHTDAPFDRQVPNKEIWGLTDASSLTCHCLHGYLTFFAFFVANWFLSVINLYFKTDSSGPRCWLVNKQIQLSQNTPYSTSYDTKLNVLKKNYSFKIIALEELEYRVFFIFLLRRQMCLSFTFNFLC